MSFKRKFGEMECDVREIETYEPATLKKFVTEAGYKPHRTKEGNKNLIYSIFFRDSAPAIEDKEALHSRLDNLEKTMEAGFARIEDQEENGRSCQVHFYIPHDNVGMLLTDSRKRLKIIEETTKTHIALQPDARRDGHKLELLQNKPGYREYNEIMITGARVDVIRAKECFERECRGARKGYYELIPFKGDINAIL